MAVLMKDGSVCVGGKPERNQFNLILVLCTGVETAKLWHYYIWKLNVGMESGNMKIKLGRDCVYSVQR